MPKRITNKTLGNRAFTVAAPRLWNSLLTAKQVWYKWFQMPPSSEFFYQGIFNTLVRLILACFVVILLQLYFNVCIIVVLIFELYVVFTSLIYDCYILLYYFFYSRIIHVVIRCNLIKLFVNLRKKIINNNNNYYYYYYC